MLFKTIKKKYLQQDMASIDAPDISEEKTGQIRTLVAVIKLFAAVKSDGWTIESLIASNGQTEGMKN